MKGRGLIHIYCGEGKGKTTAALGLSIRAAGSGMNVLMVQFLKNNESSELNTLALIPQIKIIRGKYGHKFSFQMTEEDKQRSKEIHDENLQKVIDMVQEEQWDLLVLDEIIAAYNLGLVDEKLVRKIVQEKPVHLEVVLTGRNPKQWLVDSADYVSCIEKVKHPYDQGIIARIGIEK